MPTTKWDLILKGKQYGQKVEKTSAGVDAAQWTNLFYFLTRSEYHLIWNNHTPYAYLKMFLFNSSYKRKSSMKWRAPIIITSNWRIMQVECRIIRCVRFTFWVLPLKSHQFFFFFFSSVFDERKHLENKKRFRWNFPTMWNCHTHKKKRITNTKNNIQDSMRYQDEHFVRPFNQCSLNGPALDCFIWLVLVSEVFNSLWPARVHFNIFHFHLEC